MAKTTFLSAGVYTREFDLSFLPAPIPPVGACVIGPTVRGPVLMPTKVASYSEYLRWFGDVFESGSSDDDMQSYKYLTTYAVQEYLRWGDVVTVMRIDGPQAKKVTSNIISSGGFYELTGDFGESFNKTVSETSMSFTLESIGEGAGLNSANETEGAAASESGSAEIYKTYSTDFGDASDNKYFTIIESGSNNALVSGSRYNIRWEIAKVDENRGTFDLYIRRGDDNDSRKVVLEQFSGITLDPNEPNYIIKVIGDQVATYTTDAAGLVTIQMKGNYPNRSRFVRVSNVQRNTMNYIRDNAFGYKTEYTASLPAETWGVFTGGTDDPDVDERYMYTEITRTNTQGYNLNPNDDSANIDGYTTYIDALEILSNKDQYDYDLLFMPGVIADQHREVVTRAITMVEDRGDAFLVLDPVGYDSPFSSATAAADGRNTNYAAFYWPWVQVADADLGGNYWVPASTQVAGVYAFNDYVSEKWFAPAGLNRGALDMVIQAERTLTINDRDVLYSKNVNPIATFPQNGVVVWGQKTLQKKRSALDRINVRRLLIAAKRHVANTSKYLVFEQNTAETRARFLNITKPFFDNAVQKQGIYDYRIIIDERNNTPDVIDRNEMRAQIYLKPAKTAEFIIVDFLVLPTGAAFPVDNDQ